jgi:branched-chain amino acid transport system ATP-binding protein
MTVAMRCSDVRVRYGGIEVLHGVGLAIPFGAVTALVGPNGAGKSTLLSWCAGAASTATSSGGRLELARAAQSEPLADATAWSATRRAASGLRLVRSGVNVFQSLTVKENLLAGADPKRGAEAGLEAGLEHFPELGPLLPQRAATLSGGERQLLAVACALGSSWRVLLVDEPVQGIAPALADRVFDALAAAMTPDRAVLIADPVAHRAAAVADFVWRLERGRIVFAGESAELRN